MRAPGFRLPTALPVGALTLAACAGAGNAPASAAGNAPARTEAQNVSTGLQLSQCMRAHGVPSFPDPSADGSIHLSGGINPQSPAFQSAQQACSRFAPFKGPPKMSESQRRAATRFAECMRANGQSGFPDPTLLAPPGATHVLVLRGMVFAFQGGIDPKSPAFRQAARRCGVSAP